MGGFLLGMVVEGRLVRRLAASAAECMWSVDEIPRGSRCGGGVDGVVPFLATLCASLARSLVGNFQIVGLRVLIDGI